MNVVDILIAIVVVTILVTIILAVVTYVAYKLRLSREPARSDDDPSSLRYFVRHDPPARSGADEERGGPDTAREAADTERGAADTDPGEAVSEARATGRGAT